MTEDEKLQFLRQEMNELFLDGMYDYCLMETDKFLKRLEEQKIKDMYQYYFVHMMKSRCYYHTRETQKSIMHGELALRHIKQVKNMDYNELMKNLIINIWGLANSYAKIGNLKKSMRYYNKCENYYKGKNDLINLSKVYNTKAYYSLNEKLGQKSIKMYEDLYKKNLINIKTLDNVYDTMFYIYIHYKKYNDTFNILNKIYDKTLKIRLFEKYELTISKSNQLAFTS